MAIEDDVTFHDMAAAMFVEETDALLEKQKQGIREWEGKFLALHGRSPTVRDLTVQLLSEECQRKPLLSAYSALIWKELHP